MIEIETDTDNLDAAPAPRADLTDLNARLTGKSGKKFWQSFEELAETETFQKWVEDEFPNRATLLQVDRRKFLTLGGAALGMAGLSGCRFLPQMKAVPYVRAPEELIPGKPLTYTSTFTRGGYALGVLVESHEGRPQKIEGNPNHPASLGATDVWTQAEILGLYDPDRSQAVTTNGEIASWDNFWGVADKTLSASASTGGADVAFLTESISSPTLVAQMADLLKRYPSAKWYQYEPITRDNVYAGTSAALGRPLSPVYALKAAKVIVSLDGDFLLTMPGSVRYARDFADGRRIRANRTDMNRLYTIESGYTITGAMADHRFPVKPSQVEAIARALYAAVSTGGASNSTPAGMDSKAFLAMAKDLTANRGAAVVVAGEEATAATHALVAAMNIALGAVGTTVNYTAPIEVSPGGQVAGLKALVDRINTGSVGTLFILGGNPVYNAPADLKFREALAPDKAGKSRVPFSVHLAPYEDETSQLCSWHLPLSHALETWGDARAFDGTASIVQPLIMPLYDTRSLHEVVANLIGQPQPGYDIVYNHWRSQYTGPNFAAWWEKTLLTGVVPNSASPAVGGVAAAAGFEASLPAAPAASQMEIAFKPDTTLYDGRYANNSWLQELPKPISKITWDNAAHISPRTAKQLGIIGNTDENDAHDIADKTGKQMVTLQVGGRTLDMPVWILPGQPDDVVTVHLGFGRSAAGTVGNDQGFDTYTLRTSDALASAPVGVKMSGGKYDISSTQAHHTLKGINEENNRDIIHAGTIQEYIAKRGLIDQGEEVEHSPSVTAFPKTGADEGPSQGRADGALGQEPNMRGHNQVAEHETQADSYRKQWKYTDASSSNDKGWPTLYPEFSNKNYNAWGMGIDLTTCIGCNACTIACQSENNIPTVGKEQIGKGREMYWIRIDHYYAADSLDNVESYFQPLACVHCEKAPCEPVCPVAATVHSHEGLNQMVYNRCIGTRYCSNNCPYKVRRFNFLKWTAGIGGPTTVNYDLPVLKMLANPDVTVRGRGVMEKCTYCTQRINAARIEAKKAQREIVDGEIVTACQQVCPTNAIVFGDINNPNSEVSQWRKQPHDYLLLSELNTRPRTSYLAKIRNPNPDIETATTNGNE